MNDLKLYQITEGFMQLNENEEITEEDKKQIEEQLQLALMNKSNNIIGYYEDRKSLIEAIDVQIKRLQDFKKQETNKLDRYKDYVKTNMEVLGIEKIETPVGSISLAKSPMSIEIINEDLIPEEYKEVVSTVKVDKKKIAEDFKATGEIIDGIKINNQNKYLKIK